MHTLLLQKIFTSTKKIYSKAFFFKFTTSIPYISAYVPDLKLNCKPGITPFLNFLIVVMSSVFIFTIYILISREF